MSEVLLGPLQVTEQRRDIWAEWLAVHRCGGDPDVRRRMLEETQAFREEVLDRAELVEGETLPPGRSTRTNSLNARALFVT